MNDIDQYLDDLERDFGHMLTYTSGYVCKGWEQLIRDMLTEIQALNPLVGLEEVPYGHPEFTQIKEKYGTLRVYGFNISDEQQAVIDKYERLSRTTCEVCGAEGEMREKQGWLMVRCDEHKGE